MIHPSMFFLPPDVRAAVLSSAVCYFGRTLIYYFIDTPLVGAEPTRFHRQEERKI